MAELTGLAGLFRDYGPWGLLAFAFTGWGVTLRMMRADSKEFVTLVREILSVTTAATTSSNSMVAASKELEAATGALAKSVEGLSREQEKEFVDLRHVIGNQAAGLDGCVKVLEKQAATLERLANRGGGL